MARQFPFSLAISYGLSYSGVTAESDFRRSIGVLDFRQGSGFHSSLPSLLYTPSLRERSGPSMPFGRGETFDPAMHYLFRASAARAEEAASPWLWLDA